MSKSATPKVSRQLRTISEPLPFLTINPQPSTALVSSRAGAPSAKADALTNRHSFNPPNSKAQIICFERGLVAPQQSPCEGGSANGAPSYQPAGNAPGNESQTRQGLKVRPTVTAFTLHFAQD